MTNDAGEVRGGWYNKYVLRAFQRQHVALLERAVLGSCETVLDVGCGDGIHMAGIGRHVTRLVGVDVYDQSLRKARERGVYTETRLMDVRDIGREFAPRSFECVVAFDLIEHLDKDEGESLLDAMESIASKKVVVFTPNGFLPQGALFGNEAQVHKSGWTVREMRSRGYRVVGVHGPKGILGERSNPKWFPGKFWLAVTVLMQPLFLRIPRFAFQLFCVKEMGGERRPAS